MKKSMYSLMLSEEVVERVDRIAAEKQTTRSNLINQILAEYVSLKTPEKRADDIVRRLSETLERDSGLILLAQPRNSMAFSIKTTLAVSYQPAVLYEILLSRTPKTSPGKLRVVVRTRSTPLLVTLTRFLEVWMGLETVYLKDRMPEGFSLYSMESGKFVRHFVPAADGAGREEDYADAIRCYVTVFDKFLKEYITGVRRETDAVERDYLACLENGSLRI